MADDRYQPLAEDFQRDLNPEDRAGEHHGIPSYETVPAYEIKELHDRLPEYTDDELKAIQVVAPGGRLEQGAVYIDLSDRDRGEFRAMGDMVAGRDHWYVPKRGTDYVLWNRLIGVQNPERLDEE